VGPAVDVATSQHGTAAAAALAAGDFLDLGIVGGAEASQVIETVFGRRFDLSRPRDDVVDMRCAGITAGDGARIAVAPQRFLAQLAPVRR